MSPLEDHEVDRQEVCVRISKGTQLTCTNRTIDLTLLFLHRRLNDSANLHLAKLTKLLLPNERMHRSRRLA